MLARLARCDDLAWRINPRHLSSRWYHRWELRNSVRLSKRPVELRIEDGIPDSDHVLLYEHLRGALELIATHDARRFDSLKRRIHCILIRRGYGGEYWPDVSVCVLDAAVVRRKSPAGIAASVVHELGHARVEGLLGGGFSPRLHDRIEKLCVREQLRFTARLASAGWGVDNVVRFYEALLEAPPESRAQRFARRLQALREVDAPPWVIRAFKWWQKPKTPG